MVGVPFAASSVFDELASLALDTAPGTRRRKCGQNSLDRADDVIEGAEFLNDLPSSAAAPPAVRKGSALPDPRLKIKLFWLSRLPESHRFPHSGRRSRFARTDVFTQ